MSGARQPQVILAGELADFDVSSLLAAFGLGRQLITLEIMDQAGRADGYIVIKAGRVVSALSGEHTGAEAVRRLLSNERPAHFRVLRDASQTSTELDGTHALGTIAELARLTPIPAAVAGEDRPSPVPGENGARLRSRTPPPPLPRRSSGAGSRVRVLEGAFTDIPLSALLQVVSAGRQYIEVHVLDERSVSVGVIELKAGMLVGARTRTLHGLDAAHALLDAPNSYRFVVIRRREPPRTITALSRVSRLLTRHEARGDYGFEEEPETAVAPSSLRDSDSPPAYDRQRLSTPDTPVPVLDGNFAELDLPSLIQVVGTSRQHTKLRVFDDQRQPVGELHLKSGQLLSASARDATGVAAVRRLLHSPRDFTFVVLRYPHAREPAESLGGILDVLGRATAVGNTGSFGALPTAAALALPLPAAAAPTPSIRHTPVPLPPKKTNGVAPRQGGNWLIGAALGAGFVLLGGAATALLLRPSQVTTDVSSALAKPQPQEPAAPAAAPVVLSPKPPTAAAEPAPPQPQEAANVQSARALAQTEPSADPYGKPAIASIQAGLRQLGYETGPIDGVLGPRTTAAIKAFQSDEQLISDGTLSQSTRARLSRRIGGL